MSVYPERSSIVALSCQGPVAQSPISKLSGLMSVLSLVVHKGGCSKRLEGPSPPQAAAARRSDGEDGSFDPDNRKGLQAARLEVEGPSPSGADRSMVQGGESRLGAENGIIVSPVLILGEGPGAGTPDPQGVQETKTTSA
eukprot:bmy_17471T0